MRKYTRKQINEAIQYWTNILNQLDEATNEMITQFEKVFGSDIVFSNKDFKITEQKLSKIFDILNKFLFEGSLKKYPIKIVPMSFIQNLVQKNFQIYAVYFRFFTSSENNGRYIGEILNGTQTYFISDEMYTFSMITSILCHEMIHCYIENTTTILDQIAEAHIRKILKPNTHANMFFQEKKAKANKLGLNVMDNTSGKDLNELNEMSFNVIKKTDDRKSVIESEQIMSDKNQLDLANWLNNKSDGTLYAKFIEDKHCVALMDIF